MSAFFRLPAVLALATSVLAGCGDGAPALDASRADGPLCASDEACDDGVFCNGAERCQPASTSADALGCVAPARGACIDGQTCSEATLTCTTDCAVGDDVDGDGSRAVECGGDDCDDSDAQRYAGAAEVCDADGRDEDCDPSTFGLRDADGDTFPDASCCNADVCGNDCDDAVAAVRPGAADDQCDELDNDCDSAVDEDATAAAQRLFYADSDGDGFGDVSDAGMLLCSASVPGRTLQPGDCDDDAPTTFPGASELCNRIADDCRAWPSGATSAPVRIEEDRDEDGAAAFDATCSGGPRPRVDCADDAPTRTHCPPTDRDVAGEGFLRVRAGDLDGDGDLDIVGWSSSMAVAFYNGGAGASFTRAAVGPADGMRAAMLVDIDDDGDLDVFARASGRLGWYERDGASTWTWRSLIGSGDDRIDASGRAAADLDGDGLVEVAVTAGDDVALWHRVDGEWQRHPIAIGLGTTVTTPMLVDLDGGGSHAIVVGTATRIHAYASPGSITGAWTHTELCNGGEDDVDMVDFEPDGDLDVVFTPGSTFGTVVYCTNASASLPWPARGLSALTGYAADVEAVDLDADGDGDFVIGGSGPLQWFERRIDGFDRQPLTPTPPGGARHRITTGDVDGDGDRDIVIAQSGSSSSGRLFWLEMSGGAFSTL